jgi:hypothetical protein
MTLDAVDERRTRPVEAEPWTHRRFFHRGMGEEFAPARETEFLAAHRDLQAGVERAEVTR